LYSPRPTKVCNLDRPSDRSDPSTEGLDAPPAASHGAGMEGSTRARTDAQRASEGLLAEIRRALKGKDIDALGRVYAEDAVIEEVSSLNPPAHPSLVEGREAIVERLKNEIFRDPISGWSRQLQSVEILDGMETEDALAFAEVRTYVAGDKVVAHHLARKKNGLIGHDRMVVAWDAE
jgi:hypothetical protein